MIMELLSTSSNNHYLQWFLVLCCFLSDDTVNAHTHTHVREGHRHKQRCMANDPTADDAAHLNAKIQAFQQQRSHSFTSKQSIVIPTQFIIFQPSNAPSQFTNNIITEQMTVLNENYQNTPFRFQLMNATYIVNQTYYNDMTEPNQPTIGSLYKKGGTNTLMVYWGNSKEGGSYARSPGLLHVSENDFVTDGAFMDINTVPGGTSECCNQGKTLAHEVGHWLGLYHTFYGDSCDLTNQGDFVSDTPQQASQTNFTCPIGRDSCPDLPGVDPIHNFMDYSNDLCLTEFTPRQIERMYIVWSLFRQTNDDCTSDQILFTMEIKLDSFSSETSWQLTGPDLFINPVKNGFANTEITADDTRETVIIDICLPLDQRYNFTIFDSQGDGIDSPGYYKIYLAGRLVKEGQKFGSSESTIFDATSTNISSPPTNLPTIHTNQPTKRPTTTLKTLEPTLKSKTVQPNSSVAPTTKPTIKVNPSKRPTVAPSITNLFFHATSKPKKASKKHPKSHTVTAPVTPLIPAK